MPTLQIIIKGRVQGVFYRATAKEVADELDVKGTVRNNADGNVEIIVTGSEQQLQKFESWCKRGPKGAEVTEINVVNHEEQYFDGFKILH